MCEGKLLIVLFKEVSSSHWLVICSVEVDAHVTPTKPFLSFSQFCSHSLLSQEHASHDLMRLQCTVLLLTFAFLRSDCLANPLARFNPTTLQYSKERMTASLTALGSKHGKSFVGLIIIPY